MASGSPWTEEEVASAVDAYFELLAEQERGGNPSKAALYRELNEKHPVRSAKSFEFKFQNISAVLYEEKLPYAAGLKPKFNYQKLLRDVVVSRLKGKPLKKKAPEEILEEKLLEIASRGYYKVEGRGTGRFGLTLEKALSIPQNSSKDPDFMGIELKTKASSKLTTLFSKVPCGFVNGGKREFFDIHSYYDRKRDRRALYTSFNRDGDSLGFSLAKVEDRIFVKKAGEEILFYDTGALEKALLRKHGSTAYIKTNTRKGKKGDECAFYHATIASSPSIKRFIALVESGDIFLDFTLSEKSGRLNDHGWLFRIKFGSIFKLYDKVREVDLLR